MTSPGTGAPQQFLGLPIGLIKVHRGQLIAVAVIGIVLGAIGLVFPGATLLTVAILFGSYLIASGIFRITAALVADSLTTNLRWFTGVMGLLVIVAGIFCLANPFESLVVLALVIGIGWIAEGLIDFLGALRGSIVPRWLGFVSGVIAIAGGVAMFVLPAAGLSALVTIGSVILIVVSVSTLLTLPRTAAKGQAKA
ncbi:MAG: DUF308 domain-containing protein [Burkholderiaceae bacterium]|nr:DUF308 domain-containing protein [Microbacteriaceae bacterium]